MIGFHPDNGGFTIHLDQTPFGAESFKQYA